MSDLVQSTDRQQFEKEVQRLRSLGCTCKLRWTGSKAGPIGSCARNGSTVVCDADAGDNPCGTESSAP